LNAALLVRTEIGPFPLLQAPANQSTQEGAKGSRDVRAAKFFVAPKDEKTRETAFRPGP
jgi:hypothetical protein